MKNVYFDRRYRNVLFSLALSEGLLERENETYWRNVFIEKDVTKQDIQIVLSNIAASDAVYLPPEEWLPRGRLFEGGKFVTLEYGEVHRFTNSEDEPLFPDIDCLVKFLAANGRVVTSDHVVALLERGIALEKQFENEFPGSSLAQEQISAAIREAVYRGDAKRNDLQYSLIKDLASASQQASELFAPIREFSSMRKLSNAISARILTDKVAIPFSTEANNESSISRRRSLIDINNRRLSENLTNQEFFEIVAFELGSLPFRSTLKDTMVLAEQEATIALRALVSERVSSIRISDLSVVADLKREIANASIKLAKAENQGLMANIVTYIGLPVSFAGLYSGELSLLGLGLAGLGYYAALQSQNTMTKLDWAMFGKKPLAD